LTKSSAKPEALIKAVDTGTLPHVDVHPQFRALLKHKAYFCRWLHDHIGPHAGLCSYLGFCASELFSQENSICKSADLNLVFHPDTKPSDEQCLNRPLSRP